MTADQCPFCPPAPERIFYQDPWVIGIWDAFPVNPGHALLITRRHIRDWFEASTEERMSLTRPVDVARIAIAGSFQADGYNIGINVGEAAGQTVFHLHLHVIPRVRGDVEDPRGGVRNVIPHSAKYLVSGRASQNTAALVTGGTDPLLPHLIHYLAESDSADLAVAFTLRSGLDLLSPHLQDLLDRKGSLRVLTGDYLGATDPDALLRLLDLNGNVECRVFESGWTHNQEPTSLSFHPKAYIFRRRDGSYVAFVGSSNLSETGLKRGIEWNYKALDSKDPEGIAAAIAAFERLFAGPNTVSLTPSWINSYRARRISTGRTDQSK